MNRRKFLSGAAVVGISSVSGCVGMMSENDKDGDGRQDKYDDYPEDPSKQDLIRKYQSNIFFHTEYRYREPFMETNLRFDYKLEELNGRDINVDIFTDDEYEKLATGQTGAPMLSEQGISEIENTLSIPGSFDGHIGGINIILSRGNTDTEWCRVYFSRELYR
ncbi:hypothetical protein HYG81_16990 [Natrinema zhouii]|uniref:Uncharacterized protein n=1 Tax=Natrinema zhouii TaxID=1710539 RepID=A0A7D6CQY9_9EURY|nr:hypothetical protein [Natrinema zhouii]QLK25753.1 hypothetical protein HYG81_16990 [Natrinema zhouii]